MTAILKNKTESLYIHIPFCHGICFYCDFARSVYNQDKADQYLHELAKELNNVDTDIKTIYIGGGTPTALNHQQLEFLFKQLERFKNVEEFTIEINPESFDLKKAELIKEYGVNRVSIGIQSFDEELLKTMNRKHNLKDIENVFSYLETVGIKNRSIDLIYGFKGQQIKDVIADLKQAVKLPITHVSIYELEIHDNTVFGKQGYPEIDDELSAKMYKGIIDYLKDNSFEQYEISNFCKPGYQSLHNKAYWHYDNYYGIGLAASGKLDNYRYTNTTSLQQYLEGNYCGEEVKLSHEDLEFEAIMMGLRLLEGIDITVFNEKYNVNLQDKYSKAIRNNVEKGLLEIVDNHLKTTEKGLFILNDVLVDFMELL